MLSQIRVPCALMFFLWQDPLYGHRISSLRSASKDLWFPLTISRFLSCYYIICMNWSEWFNCKYGKKSLILFRSCFQFYKSLMNWKHWYSIAIILVPLFERTFFCQRRTMDSKNKAEYSKREKVLSFSIRMLFKYSKFKHCRN